MDSNLSTRSTFGDGSGYESSIEESDVFSSGRIIWESPEDEVINSDDESITSLSTLTGRHGKVYVNGQLLPNHVVNRAERLAGPIDPGNYWYDHKAGFWGEMGHHGIGIIPPYIKEFDSPMPENCSGGDTNVYVNGRELHFVDLRLLATRGFPTTSCKRYTIDISGELLEEDTKNFVVYLGKLAPTIERMGRGFGMRVPKTTAFNLDDNLTNNSSPRNGEVFVNGQHVPHHVVERAEKHAGTIKAGYYWYDPKGGFWGVMGHPSQGILPPCIEELSFPMPEDCSYGDTTVYVNGRELTKIDLDLLVRRGLPTTRNMRYIITISGKVMEDPSEEFVINLGKLAPTVEKLKRGFGMHVPENLK